MVIEQIKQIDDQFFLIKKQIQNFEDTLDIENSQQNYMNSKLIEESMQHLLEKTRELEIQEKFLGL